MNNTSELKPFVKWVGGKRQILNEILSRMPKKFNKYYEPFVGGGALFLKLTPKNANINDINSELIHAYKVIRDFPVELIDKINYLDKFANSKDDYYEIIKKYNEKIFNNEYDFELAAFFIYLNKRCFNGLYRVNSSGKFNVPYNNKKLIKSISEDNIVNLSKYLKQVNISNSDFETILDSVRKNDFVFLDSPYVPLNSTTFESYTKEGFSIENHIRLANLFKKLTDIGCYVMLTNHNTQLIHKLYSDYKIEIIPVKRMINSNSLSRTGEEVIITNY